MRKLTSEIDRRADQRPTPSAPVPSVTATPASPQPSFFHVDQAQGGSVFGVRRRWSDRLSAMGRGADELTGLAYAMRRRGREAHHPPPFLTDPAAGSAQSSSGVVACRRWDGTAGRHTARDNMARVQQSEPLRFRSQRTLHRDASAMRRFDGRPGNLTRQWPPSHERSLEQLLKSQASATVAMLHRQQAAARPGVEEI